MDDFVGVATYPYNLSGICLPKYARFPINRCNLPAIILGSLTFQQYPVPLQLDGVAQFHHGLFELLGRINDQTEHANAFSLHMQASFFLGLPEQAGLTTHTKLDRSRADYLRTVRGWGFDSDGREGAVMKGWVESRFGLMPRYHAGPIRDFSDITYRNYLELRSAGLYGTNALESQLDLLYTYAQYELGHQKPNTTHIILYRGINHMDEYEVLGKIDGKKSIVLLNSLNSFTANRERADEFGDYLISTEVPLSKIFFYTGLLPGMLSGEEEYAVIGGLYEVTLSTN